MLPVIVDQTREGKMCPRLYKSLLPKPNHKTCSTSTWAITTSPMTTLRHRGIVVVFVGDNARIVQDVPAQAPFAPPAPVCTTDLITSYTYLTLHHLQRRSMQLTTKSSSLQLAPLQPSSMNCLSRSLTPMGGPLKSFGNWQLSTGTTLVHKLLGFVWNLAKPME